MKKRRTMEDFPNLYKKPPHLWLESKEFDDVRGKTREQVLSEIREESKRLFGTGPKPTGSSPKPKACGGDCDSTVPTAEAEKMPKDLKDFLNLYKKPPHLWLESKEFDDVRGKTRGQVLSEIREEAERRFGSDAKPKPSSHKRKPRGSKAKAA